jgi:peptidoglycan hydrolase-like protein with peptidoglycan-binding domain
VLAHIGAPSLSLGAHGPGVVALERRLAELHYAVRNTSGVFDADLEQSVLAFQKVNGLPRTGVVTPSLWARLAQAGVPFARYSGNHVEVDKTRQVLFLVRAGKVALVSAASTGATGNTPLGVWHVYSKVAGWSWVLWYPSYFLRGFAVHGYPDVPPYPASHGCVRIPMWLAPSLYTQIPLGSSIYIYA